MEYNLQLPQRFELVKHIATGGMAEVFLCRQKGSEGFSKLVAIKKILHQFSSDERFLRMFTREAKLAAMLNHNNICKVYDFIKYGSEYFLIMEYINGITLRDLIEKLQKNHKRIPIQVSLGIILNIAKSLYYIHSLKDRNGNPLELVHRDVTPSNIMLSDKGEIKLMDFGIAKIEGLPTGSTSTGEIKGKIGYLSPEQIEGLDLDHRSDLFSLGIIFYELLSSKRLFVGDSQYSILYKIKRADIEPISQVLPYIDSELETIVMKCLSKDRDKRYRNGKQLIIDINNYSLKKGYYFSEENLGDIIESVFEQDQITHDELQIDPASDFEVPDMFDSVNEEESSEPDDFINEINKIEKKTHRVKYLFLGFFSILIFALIYFLFLDRHNLLDRLLITDNTINETVEEPEEKITIFDFLLNEDFSLEIENGLILKEGKYILTDEGRPRDINIKIMDNTRDGYFWTCSMTIDNDIIIFSPDNAIEFDLKEQTYLMSFNKENMVLNFSIDSDPSNASIIKEGEDLGFTPMVMTLEPSDSWDILLKKDGFEDKAITVNTESILKRTFESISLTKKILPGRLAIRSEFNANLSINRRNRGRVVGDRTFELEPGNYNIRLIGENVFYHFEKTVSIKENETIRIDTPKIGYIDIRATPSRCRVYINDIPLEQEPPIQNMSIAEGNYKITVHWEQFNQKREYSFRVSAGERKTLPLFALN